MEPTPELTIERLTAEPSVQPPASTIKTILLHIQNDASLEARLQAGLSLARATGAHLRCLHVTPIEAYVTMDGFGGVFVMDKLIERIDQEEEDLRSGLRARLDAEDVAWDYEQVTANTVSEIVRRSALSDITIMGRQAHIGRSQGLEVSILGDVLMAIRTPLLIPGDAEPVFDPFGPAVIAWNGSYEAANAVRGALGLLKLSADVRVVQFDDNPDSTPTGLLEFLSRHGIHAQFDHWTAQGDSVPSLLTEYASDKAASFIVMGAYGHARAGELLFGGVTRSLLKGCPSALVLAH